MVKDSPPKRYWWNVVGRLQDATVDIASQGYNVAADYASQGYQTAANAVNTAADVVTDYTLQLIGSDDPLDMENVLKQSTYEPIKKELKISKQSNQSKLIQPKHEHTIEEKKRLEAIYREFEAEFKEKKIKSPVKPLAVSKVELDITTSFVNQEASTAAKDIHDFKKLFDKFGDKSYLKKIVTRVAKFFKTVGNFFKDKIERIADVFIDAADRIKRAAPHVASIIKEESLAAGHGVKATAKLAAQTIGKKLGSSDVWKEYHIHKDKAKQSRQSAKAELRKEHGGVKARREARR